MYSIQVEKLDLELVEAGLHERVVKFGLQELQVIFFLAKQQKDAF